MSTIDTQAMTDRIVLTAAVTAPGIPVHSATAHVERPRRLVFWICRYLPAEVAGTAAMVLAGLGITAWTDSPPIIALAALLGEIVGFYAVLALTVYGEQWSHLQDASHARRRALLRTTGLLVAEFGAAELIDTLLVRPAALLVGVLTLGPLWGMIAGKVVADVVFYAVAAGAFTLTDRAGLRRTGQTVP